jgi:flagellar biosynthesis/type III secretory pathway protein FliH
MNSTRTEPVLPEPAILLSIDLPMVSGGAVKKQAFYSAAQYQAAYQAGLKAGREQGLEAAAKRVESQDTYGDPVKSWFDLLAAAIRNLGEG